MVTEGRPLCTWMALELLKSIPRYSNVLTLMLQNTIAVLALFLQQSVDAFPGALTMAPSNAASL